MPRPAAVTINTLRGCEPNPGAWTSGQLRIVELMKNMHHLGPVRIVAVFIRKVALFGR
jgi:hypothetical protein